MATYSLQEIRNRASSLVGPSDPAVKARFTPLAGLGSGVFALASAAFTLGARSIARAAHAHSADPAFGSSWRVHCLGARAEGLSLFSAGATASLAAGGPGARSFRRSAFDRGYGSASSA